MFPGRRAVCRAGVEGSRSGHPDSRDHHPPMADRAPARGRAPRRGGPRLHERAHRHRPARPVHPLRARSGRVSDGSGAPAPRRQVPVRRLPPAGRPASCCATTARRSPSISELQSRVRIRTPRCYFAAIEGDGPEHMLLLEDLAPAVQGDQLAWLLAGRGASRGAGAGGPARAELVRRQALRGHRVAGRAQRRDRADRARPLPRPAACLPRALRLTPRGRRGRHHRRGPPTRRARPSSPWATSSVWSTWTTGSTTC